MLEWGICGIKVKNNLLLCIPAEGWCHIFYVSDNEMHVLNSLTVGAWKNLDMLLKT